MENNVKFLNKGWSASSCHELNIRSVKPDNGAKMLVTLIYWVKSLSLLLSKLLYFCNMDQYTAKATGGHFDVSSWKNISHWVTYSKHSYQLLFILQLVWYSPSGMTLNSSDNWLTHLCWGINAFFEFLSWNLNFKIKVLRTGYNGVP